MYRDSVLYRFWQYVNVTSKRKCWEWQGSLMVRGGYGQLNDRGILLKTHRLSYELHLGQIPENKMVCHKCNNPKCCNPKHLYVGDNMSNTRDKIRAGTQYKIPPMKGESSPSAKLTWGQVREIRASSESGVYWAKKLGVTKTSISRIRKNKTWKE